MLVCQYTWSILVFGTHKCSESLDFAATICETLGHWSSCTAQDEFTKKYKVRIEKGAYIIIYIYMQAFGHDPLDT